MYKLCFCIILACVILIEWFLTAFVIVFTAERAVGKLSYTIETLLHYAASPLSKLAPNCFLPPEMSRKVTSAAPVMRLRRFSLTPHPPTDQTTKMFQPIYQNAMPVSSAFRYNNTRNNYYSHAQDYGCNVTY